MANKKKAVETEVKQISTITTETDFAKENEDLKAQLAAMQAQMELLAKQVASPKESVVQKKKKEKTINFVNMTRGSLVLRGTQLWTIDGQFNSRSFSEREARMIVNNMGKTVRSGLVYISDAEFVEENDLGEAYQNILSNEQLKSLFNQNASYVIEAYKMVSDLQKKIIIDMIVEKKENGLPVDANILVELGKLSGKDLISIEKEED